MLSQQVLCFAAVSGYGGAKLGTTFASQTMKMKSDFFGPDALEEKTKKTNLDIDVDGATFFTEGKNQFGIGYGVRLDFPLVEKDENGNKTPKEQMIFKFGFAPKVTFQYRYAINKDLDLEAGAGFEWAFYSRTVTEGGVSVTAKLNILKLLANVGVAYKINDTVGLRAGFELGAPVKANMKYIGNGTEIKPTCTIKGIAFTPFVGVSVFY